MREIMLRYVHLFVIVALIIPLGGFKGKEGDVRIYHVPKKNESVPDLKTQAAETPQEAPSVLVWDTPEGWIQDAVPGMMQLASFDVFSEEEGDTKDSPNTKSNKAKASIVVLAGLAGGMVANVNRWRGQAGLPPQESSVVESSAHKLLTPLGEADWFHIIGEEKAVLVAIIYENGRSIFIKIIGDPEAVDDNKDKFLKFTSSIRAE